MSAWPIPAPCRWRSPPGKPMNGSARPGGGRGARHCAGLPGTAPKSNAVYAAWGEAQRAARETGSLMPPKHILNAPTRLMKNLGYGKDYAYDHEAEERFSGQEYFPDEMER